MEISRLVSRIATMGGEGAPLPLVARMLGQGQILGKPEAVLKPEEYPEFEGGSEAWVGQLREQDGRIDDERLGGWGSRVDGKE